MRWAMVVLAAEAGLLSALAGNVLAQENALLTLRANSTRDPGRIEWLPTGISHTTFGFWAPSPGNGFAVPVETQSLLDAHAGATDVFDFWVFTRDGDSEVVLVQAVHNAAIGRDEAGLRAYARELRAKVRDAKVLEDTIEWRDGVREYRLGYRTPGRDRRYIRSRCVSSGETRAEPIVVCLTTQSAKARGFDGVRLGLRLTPAP